MLWLSVFCVSLSRNNVFGLQSVIVVFPGLTHLLFAVFSQSKQVKQVQHNLILPTKTVLVGYNVK